MASAEVAGVSAEAVQEKVRHGQVPDERVWRAWRLAMSRKGWCRRSGSPQAAEAMNNAWFAEMGLIPLALPVARNLVVPQEARHVVRERGG